MRYGRQLKLLRNSRGIVKTIPIENADYFDGRLTGDRFFHAVCYTGLTTENKKQPELVNDVWICPLKGLAANYSSCPGSRK